MLDKKDMQELDSFKSQLRTLWSPAVAVIASPEAEKLCWESNGLTVAELLSPFGVLSKMNGGMGGNAARIDCFQYFLQSLFLPI